MEILIKRINQGYYITNNKLPSERELSNEFGYSRTTIRTALLRLQNQNIIKIIPKSGAYIQTDNKLNFIQAMKKVFNGKKVRTNYFKEGVYIYFDSKLSAESVDNSGVMVYNNGCRYEYIIKERDLFADFYIVEGDK